MGLSETDGDCADESSILSSPALGPLQDLVNLLEDGLDHPEAWQVLQSFSSNQAVVGELSRVIRALRPVQTEPKVTKGFDIIAALLLVLTGEKAGGLSVLRRLSHTQEHCPQIAGALFFAERFRQSGKSADLSDRFCEAPFVKFETLMVGTVAPCCSIWTQKRLGLLERQDFDEIWNGQAAREMRTSILDGSYRYCNKQRCTLIMEDSLPFKKDVTDPQLRDIIDQNRIELETPPRWLFLAHDITCNLSCPSCRNQLLAADEAQERRFEIVERQVFHPLLARQDKMTISVSGQGDPFSSQHYRSLLRYMADNDLNLRLMLHTNALLMTEQKWERLLGLEKYEPSVDVSIDACTPWVYEVVRRPGKWEKLVENLRFIARKRAAGVFVEFHLNATIQLDNYHQLGDLVSFSEELGADSMRLYMIQNTGAHIRTTYAQKNVAREAPLAPFISRNTPRRAIGEQAGPFVRSFHLERTLESYPAAIRCPRPE